jgi:hypothetical protein
MHFLFFLFSFSLSLLVRAEAGPVFTVQFIRAAIVMQAVMMSTLKEFDELLADLGSGIAGQARVPVGASLSWLARFHFVSLQIRPQAALFIHRSCIIISSPPYLLQRITYWQCRFRHF